MKIIILYYLYKCYKIYFFYSNIKKLIQLIKQPFLMFNCLFMNKNN